MKYLLPFLIGCCFCSRSAAQAGSVDLVSGSTTIGSYGSVTGAYAAIPAGISQPYVIELKATYTGANETYPIVFVSKTGASETNTITLRPAAGVASVGMSSTVASGNGILYLNNADYVIIDGRPGGTGTSSALTISNMATGSNTIQLSNGACFNTVRNVVLQNGGAGSGSRVVNIGFSATNPTGNSNNLFAYITAIGSRYGINSNGTQSNPNTNNTIYGCHFTNVVFSGVWYQAYSGKMTVDSCRFTTTSASTTNPSAILCDQQTDTLILTRNTISGLQASGSSAFIRGIHIRTTAGTSYSYIANNFISLAATNANIRDLVGILYEGSVSTKAEIYHNSVYIGGNLSEGGTAGTLVSAAFDKEHTGAGSTFLIRNNLWVNGRTGGTTGVQHPALALSSIAGSFVMDGNTYNAATDILLRRAGTTYTGITDWQAALVPNEQTSNRVAVPFTDSVNLHLAGTAAGNTSLGAVPVAGLTTDIDNELRHTVLTYRGADEIAAAPLPVSLLTLQAQLVGNHVAVQWHTATESNNQGFRILRSLDGRLYHSIGFVAGVGNSRVPQPYHFTDTDLPAVDRWYYRLEQQDTDGRKRPSAVVAVTRIADSRGLSAVISPNPVQDRFEVRILAPVQAPAMVSLSNASGQRLAQRRLTLSAGSNLLVFEELTGQPAGSYYLLIRTGSQTRTLPLVKVK